VSEEEVEKGEEAQQLDLLSELLPDVISAFKRLDDDGRRNLFRAIGSVFGFDSEVSSSSSTRIPAETAPGRFSKDHPVSPKEFLLQKQPRSDVERVACLAYYLTHYRDQPHFKTLEISKLNTEAAQIKFSNPIFTVNNAATMGYLAQASRGNKQISAAGELFVAALPDREAAQAAMANARPKRKSKRPTPEPRSMRKSKRPMPEES
jgi:hypothetical protein